MAPTAAVHNLSLQLNMMSLTWTMRDPRTLLYDLIDERCTQHEHSEWTRAHAAVLDGSLPRNELLEALDWAVWRFSSILTSKLHDNFMANLKSVHLTTGNLQSCTSFHHEWAWKLFHLPSLVATLKALTNENLLLGIEEMVGDRRAVNMGLIRYVIVSSDRRNNSARSQD